MRNKKSIGLPNGPNEFLKDITQYISVEGYKRYSEDINNPYNIIESGYITMEDVDFPVKGIDNLGNEQIMMPGMNYQFPGDSVLEVPMAQEGIEVPLNRGEIFNIPRTMAYEDDKMVVQDQPIYDGMLDEAIVTPYTQSEMAFQERMNNKATGRLQPVYPVFDMMTLGLKPAATAGTKVLQKGFNKLPSKINPKYYNPTNIAKGNPNVYYRQVGEEAFEDFNKSGFLRTRAEVTDNPIMGLLETQKEIRNIKEGIKKAGDFTYRHPQDLRAPFFSRGQTTHMRDGKADYLFQTRPERVGQDAFVSGQMNVLHGGGKYGNVSKGGFGVMDPMQRGADNFDVFKKNWWSGYKQIKQDGGEQGIQVPKRNGVRKNSDGTESTHLMATETLDGKNWFSFPTLFQNEDSTWLDMSDKPWMEAYKEATKRGEVIEFGTDKDAAIKFGEGSWKPKAQVGQEVIRPNRDPYEYKSEADKFYTRKREGEWESEEQPDWTLASGNAEKAIREKIYNEDVSDSGAEDGKALRETGNAKTIQENIQALDTSSYGLRVIAYPIGHEVNLPGHIEAVLFDKKTGKLINRVPGTKFKGHINRWAKEGNKPVVESNYKGDKNVQVVDLRLPDDELKDFLVEAQGFLPNTKGKIHKNLGLSKNKLPISSGNNPKEYGIAESNCATGMCLGLGLDPDSPKNQTAGITDPSKVMDNILTNFSSYYDSEKDYRGNKVSKIEGIKKLISNKLEVKGNTRAATAIVDYLDGLDGKKLKKTLEELSENPMIQKMIKSDNWKASIKPLVNAPITQVIDAYKKTPDGTLNALMKAYWEQYPNQYIRENTPFDFSEEGVDNMVPWWENNVINPLGEAGSDAIKSVRDFFDFKEGGSVSWQFKGKSYSGTLIPGMETENNRYARTHNGKIKTLPKGQVGKEIKTGRGTPGLLDKPYLDPGNINLIYDEDEVYESVFDPRVRESRRANKLAKEEYERKVQKRNKDIKSIEEAKALYRNVWYDDFKNTTFKTSAERKEWQENNPRWKAATDTLGRYAAAPEGLNAPVSNASGFEYTPYFNPEANLTDLYPEKPLLKLPYPDIKYNLSNLPEGVDETEFRKWVNYYYPDYAVENDISSTTPSEKENDFIKSAWYELGNQYEPFKKLEIKKLEQPALKDKPQLSNFTETKSKGTLVSTGIGDGRVNVIDLDTGGGFGTYDTPEQARIAMIEAYTDGYSLSNPEIANISAEDLGNLYDVADKQPAYRANNRPLTNYEKIQAMKRKMSEGGQYQTGGEHTVSEGETFYGIANKNKISWKDLEAFNPDIDINALKKGQTINLSAQPTKTKKTTEEKREPTSWTDYINPYNWGVSDRDDDGSYNQAFRAARNAGEDEFMWYGKRYTTELDKTDVAKEKEPVKKEVSNYSFQEYQDDLKAQENLSLKGWDPKRQLWFPTPAPEENGGFDIGYGHKIKKGENFSKGLTDDQVNNLFAKDLNVKFKAAKSTFNRQGLNRSWDELNEQEQILLGDYQYNGVLGDFEKLMKAVANKDKDSMLKEYVRYQGKEKLGRRNDWTKSYIDSEINYKKGGEPNPLTIYSNYINGDYDGTDLENQAIKIYDRLNRIHYGDAKSLGMSPVNYILTHVVAKA